VREWRRLAVGLASETADIIHQEISNLGRDTGKDLKGDARLKALLTLTKAVQSMEDLINRMERAIEQADRYPHDIVEFREKLERHIAAIVDEEAET
jgi:hypothetical protein